MSLFFGWGLEGGNPCEVVAEDQRVDVVGSLIGVDGLDIHQVTHDGVLVDDAVGAVDLPRRLGAVARHGDIVAACLIGNRILQSLIAS